MNNYLGPEKKNENLNLGIYFYHMTNISNV